MWSAYPRKDLSTLESIAAWALQQAVHLDWWAAPPLAFLVETSLERWSAWQLGFSQCSLLIRKMTEKYVLQHESHLRNSFGSVMRTRTLVMPGLLWTYVRFRHWDIEKNGQLTSGALALALGQQASCGGIYCYMAYIMTGFQHWIILATAFMCFH